MMQQKIISSGLDLHLAPDPWTQWVGSPAGRYLVNWQQRQYDLAVSDVFGFHAVQLGFVEIRGLHTSRIASRNFSRIAGRDFAGTTTYERVEPADGVESHSPAATAPLEPIAPPEPIVAHEPIVRPEPVAPPTWTSELIIDSFEELPFAEQSIDLILLPHVLELAGDPYQTLREVNRVLRPDGRVIISGLNPISLWGARQAAGRPFGRYYMPDERRMIGPPRLKDWLRLLSFEIDSIRYGCYRPPLTSAKAFERGQFLERAGDRWWPICGAVYVLSAIKRVRAMRLVGPSWKREGGKRHGAIVASPRFETPVPTPPPARFDDAH